MRSSHEAELEKLRAELERHPAHVRDRELEKELKVEATEHEHAMKESQARAQDLALALTLARTLAVGLGLALALALALTLALGTVRGEENPFRDVGGWERGSVLWNYHFGLRGVMAIVEGDHVWVGDGSVVGMCDAAIVEGYVQLRTREELLLDREGSYYLERGGELFRGYSP
jgi:hypothetical protein